MIKRILRIAALAVAFAAGSVAAQSPIVVGGKNFTEQQIMAELTARLLEKNGFKVDKRAGMGTAVLRAAQENGQVDVYWEYTGTSLITFNKVNDPLNAEETYKRVKQLDAAKGLEWLKPSAANNTYAFAMNQDQANKLGIRTLSDLSAVIKKGQLLTFASNAEFYSRVDGLTPLQKLYNFEFGRENVKRMDTGLTYQALKDRQVDVGLVFATDGRVPAFNFVLLTDDKGFFPSYALTPVIRTSTLKANPKLADLLNALSAKLDDKVMARLNASVDVDKKSVEAVAESFLKQVGLL